ncbi:DUF3800 domain-containing protein [Streptomyces sp. MN03-5084-2B]|nr:DUF3800 domain-containing protein [Streptomyces sp. MN03-5084-2B]
MDEVPLPTIYFDESGNAGENLLDAEQPVFALASVLLDDSTAAKVIATVRAELRSGGPSELKYSTLRKTARGRAAVEAGLLAVDSTAGKVYVTHRRWMLVTKVVDLLVAERTDRLGYDIRANREAPKIANLIYIGGPKYGDPCAFDVLLETFARFAKNPDGVGVPAFASAIRQYVVTLTREGRDALGAFLIDLDREAHIYAQARKLGDHEDTLDPAIPCMDFLCRRWFEQVGRFNIVHDESKVTNRSVPLFRAADQWQDPLHPWKRLPKFPVDQFTFGDSKTVDQLQIVDWIAGAVCALGKSAMLKQPSPLSAELQDHVMEWVVDSMFSNEEDNSPF